VDRDPSSSERTGDPTGHTRAAPGRAAPGRAAGAVIWFRRDLRVEDNPALAAAVDHAGAMGAGVAPLFVADETLLRGAGRNRRAFLAGGLAALTDHLDGSLTLRWGRPAEVVPAFAAETGAAVVFATGDVGGWARRRDGEVAAALAAGGRRLVLVSSPFAVAPGRILSGSGRPYQVFTPFSRAWAAAGHPEPIDIPAPARWVARDHEVTGEEIAGTAGRRGAGDGGGRGERSPRLPPSGEAAAAETLAAFLDGPVRDYGHERDIPADPGTSRLSPYLHFGMVHPRQILARLPECPGADVFRSELAWREFAADVLWHRPRAAWEPFQPFGRHLRVDGGPDAEVRFEAWRTGRTGFPLVDAGMRQLLSEGWMHNRVRMVVASFLVKDLHLDWRRGARWFLDQLVDGDLASNSLGWQWAAGVGTDAAPFPRVFNPETQRRRFDPDDRYVRRHVPEASGFGYPGAIVDHAAERAEALRRFDDARAAAGREAGGGEHEPPGRRRGDEHG